jgi:hypothetical protein
MRIRVVLRPFSPPVADPVTVMASNVLVPMLVPAASRPLAPLVVIEIVPALWKLTVPALLRRTPGASELLTVRFEMSQVPVVASSSSPGCVPAGVDDVDVVDRAAAGVARRAGIGIGDRQRRRDRRGGVVLGVYEFARLDSRHVDDGESRAARVLPGQQKAKLDATGAERSKQPHYSSWSVLSKRTHCRPEPTAARVGEA